MARPFFVSVSFHHAHKSGHHGRMAQLHEGAYTTSVEAACDVTAGEAAVDQLRVEHPNIHIRGVRASPIESFLPQPALV